MCKSRGVRKFFGLVSENFFDESLKASLQKSQHDNRHYKIKLSKSLNNYFTSYQASESPFEGLNEAKENRYDILILDIGMPDLDGYELMKQFRSWEKATNVRKIPAIALTAFASASDARKAQEAGYQVHLSKPVNLKVLENTIPELVQGSDPG